MSTTPTPVEHAVDFAQDVEEATENRKSDFLAKTRLTQSAAEWDIDGDGDLDETELALRNLDKSHKGTLNKNQMYNLMAENLKAQRDLFKVKKVVAGLVAFTCILAISNLGTSIAAAFLAKDTKSVNNNLVDTKTGKVLATNTYAMTYEGNSDLAEELNDQRRLVDYDMTASGFTAFDRAMGREMVNACRDNTSAVRILKCFDNNNPNRCMDWEICPVHAPMQASYGGSGNDPSLTILNRSPEFKLQKEGNAYSAEGLTVSSGGFCDFDTDCDSNLVCQETDGIKKCTDTSTAVDPAPSPSPVAATVVTPAPVESRDIVCDDGQPCTGDQTCSSGTESCCGQTYAALECQCDAGSGTFMCFHTDACMVPQCCMAGPPLGDGINGPSVGTCENVGNECENPADGYCCYDFNTGGTYCTVSGGI